ncbi:hypothetical protein MPSEU_000759400 [Mayamaea pseudoterrestris]|nr:hypothetical protein MPSEU_000759400 [Mayamaea pseudoterrestris]
MMRRLCVLASVLALHHGSASAEYLRERRSTGAKTFKDDMGSSTDHQSTSHAIEMEQKEQLSRRLKLMEANPFDSSYDDFGDWETFLKDQISSSMSMPTGAPSQPSATGRPTQAPVRGSPAPQSPTPRPTLPITSAPVSAQPILAPASAPPTRRPTRRSPRPTLPPVATIQPTNAPQTAGPAPTLTPVLVPTSIHPTSAAPVITTPAPVIATSAPVLTTNAPSVAPPTQITALPTQTPITAAPVAPSAAPSGQGPSNTLLDLIQSTPRYSLFAQALQQSDQATIVDTEELTVFVPPNSEMSNPYITETLLGDPNYRLHLTSLVRNHLTNQGVYTTANLTNGLLLTMLGNEQTNVTIAANGSIVLNTFAARLGYTGASSLRRTDAVASNGVLHEAGAVLYPAWSFLNLMDLLGLLESKFSTLIGLLESSGLAQTLQNAKDISLVAPTNEAFAALPPQVITQLSNPANVDQLTQVLMYHVIPGVIDFEELPTGETMFATEQGEDVTIGRRQRPNGSIDLFFNGNRSSLFYLTQYNIVYELDAVMLPPSYAGTLAPTSAPAPSPAPTPGGATRTLASIIASNPNYSTLLGLLKDGGLLTTLNQTNSGPFTVYAPTNDAFDALGQTYLTALSTEGYSLHLSNLLLDHVQNERVSTAQLVDGLVLTMANGLAVTVSNDGTSIELITSSVELGETPAINIVPPEVNALNGVLHQVDSVILPAWYFFNTLEALEALPDTFGNLTSLIQRAGLTSVYSNLVGRTVAAPNNAAIQGLPAATLAFLTDRTRLPELTDVLVYHVIQNLLPFPTLPVGSFDANTLLGEDITVTVSQNAAGGKLLSFNGISGVGQGFFLTKNNLIYEIGGVLIPPSLQNVIPM